MKKLSEETSGQILSSNEIIEVFRIHQIEVPQQLIDFFVINNSQTYLEKFYVLSDGLTKEMFKIRGWFSIIISSEIAEPLNLTFQGNFKHSRTFLPVYFIPFAYNDMNDYYVLSNRIEDYGAIYFVRNDMHYEEVGAKKWLSNSLEEFVSEILTIQEIHEIGLEI